MKKKQQILLENGYPLDLVNRFLLANKENNLATEEYIYQLKKNKNWEWNHEFILDEKEEICYICRGKKENHNTNFEKNDETFDENKKLCPYKDCFEYVEKKEEKYVYCPKYHRFCYDCLSSWHYDKFCLEKSLDKNNCIFDNEEMDFCKNEKCKMVIEKKEDNNLGLCIFCEKKSCFLCEKILTNDYHFFFMNILGCPGLLNNKKPFERKKKFELLLLYFIASIMIALLLNLIPCIIFSVVSLIMSLVIVITLPISLPILAFSVSLMFVFFIILILVIFFILLFSKRNLLQETKGIV